MANLIKHKEKATDSNQGELKAPAGTAEELPCAPDVRWSQENKFCPQKDMKNKGNYSLQEDRTYGRIFGDTIKLIMACFESSVEMCGTT